MRIVCPSCAAEYEVPEAMLAAGARRMRCARCAHQFAPAAPSAPPAPPVAEQAPPPPPPPPPAAPPSAAGVAAGLAETAPPRSPAPKPGSPPPTRGLAQHSPIVPPGSGSGSGHPAPETPRARLLRGLAWGASVGLLAVAAGAAIHYRDGISAAWPPATWLYRALGLA